VIDVVSDRLVALLNAAARLNGDADVAGLAYPDDPGPYLLGVFPYAVVETVALKNEPPEHAGHDRLRRPTLSLDVHYLLTAYVPSSRDATDSNHVDDSHTRLAAAMLALHENATLRESIELPGGDPRPHEVRISLNPISVEDMMRIWGAFPQRPYRLSVAYLATPVPVVSSALLGTQRVVRRDTRTGVLVRNGER
jgi:hypothetical protein